MKSEDRSTGENTEQCATYINVNPAEQLGSARGCSAQLSSHIQVRSV